MNPKLFLKFDENPYGRDLAVGDIHGNFPALRELLDRVGFDETKDRLYGVGDTVDRGKHSELIEEWAKYSWFKTIRGNHEQMILKLDLNDREEREWAVQHGSAWFLCLPKQEQIEFRLLFGSLPVAIQVGDVGLVHANVPWHDWGRFTASLEDYWNPDVINHAIWSRERARDKTGEIPRVKGIRAVVVGHTVMQDMKVKSENVYHIDTGYCYGGKLTLFDLKTLEVVATLDSDGEFKYPWGDVE